MPRDVARGPADCRLQNRSPFIRAVKDCVAALFRESGGHKCAIDRFGVSLARAYSFTDHHRDEQISFARVAALTSSKATAAARYLATLAGGVFCPLAATRSANVLALAAEAARADGQAIAETIKAKADGAVTPAEARLVVKEIDEAICNLASLRGAVIAMTEAPHK